MAQDSVLLSDLSFDWYWPFGIVFAPEALTEGEPLFEDIIWMRHPRVSVNTLPQEMLVEVFDYCQLHSAKGSRCKEDSFGITFIEPSAYSAPLNISQVCSHWRRLVLNTSRYWSSICLWRESRCAPKLLESWAARAGSKMLSIKIASHTRPALKTTALSFSDEMSKGWHNTGVVLSTIDDILSAMDDSSSSSNISVRLQHISALLPMSRLSRLHDMLRGGVAPVQSLHLRRLCIRGQYERFTAGERAFPLDYAGFPSLGALEIGDLLEHEDEHHLELVSARSFKNTVENFHTLSLHLDSSTLETISDNMKFAGRLFPNLRRLFLSMKEVHLFEPESDTAMPIESFQKLDELSISFSESTQDCLRSFIHSLRAVFAVNPFPVLRIFSIHCEERLTDEGLKVLAEVLEKNGAKVEELHLRCIFERESNCRFPLLGKFRDSIHRILQSVPNLKKLHLCDSLLQISVINALTKTSCATEAELPRNSVHNQRYFSLMVHGLSVPDIGGRDIEVGGSSTKMSNRIVCPRLEEISCQCRYGKYAGAIAGMVEVRARCLKRIILDCPQTAQLLRCNEKIKKALDRGLDVFLRT